MKKTHRNSVRMLALIVSLMMLIAMLAACQPKSESNGTQAGETKETTEPVKEQLKEVTLKFFFPGDDRPAKNEVLNALYEKTKDKLNAKFEFNFTAFGDYQNKLTMMAASGDDYDCAFTADWFGYSTMVNKGAFLDITDLEPKYAPNLYKIYKDGNMLAPASVNGRIMALPWTEIKTSKPVFAFRQDIADKVNVKPEDFDLTTIEGIDKFLTAIKKGNPPIEIFDMNIGAGNREGDIITLLTPKYEYAYMGFHHFYFDLNDPTVKIVPVEQTPMFKEAVQLAKKWYDEGIISKNALAEKETKRYESCKTFSIKNISEKLYENVLFTDKTAVNKAFEVYPNNKQPRDSQMNNAMAINKNAANPERTLMFFDLFSTNEDIYDALLFGIKDKTYTIDDKGVVGFTKDEDPAKPLWQNWNYWGMWRTEYTKPTAMRGLDAIAKERAYATRSNIVLSPLTGFVPTTDTIKTEIAQRDQLFEEQGKLLLAGIIKDDIDTDINNFIEKQKKAGLDKVLADVQKQVDDFMKK